MEAAMTMTNWDVLLEVVGDKDIAIDNDQENALQLLVQSSSTSLIGNNRFQVLLDMHRAEYTAAHATDDATDNASVQERDAVVAKILDIVRRQCVPNGRFLSAVVSNRGNDNGDDDDDTLEKQWHELPEDRARAFVHQALQAPPVAIPPPLSVNKEKKRRRRSSLLRRSISESSVPVAHGHAHANINNINSNDGKKNRRRGSFLKTAFLWTSLRVGKKESTVLVDSPAPLDVLLTLEQTAFLEYPHAHVGNNRLRILLEIERDHYATTTLEQRLEIVQDLVQTVKEHWGGRFLAATTDTVVQQQQSYTVCTQDQAIEALQCIFAASCSQHSELHRESSEGTASFISTATTTTTATTATATASNLYSSGAGSLSTDIRPSAVKREAVQALHTLGPAPNTVANAGAVAANTTTTTTNNNETNKVLGDMQHMRSQAVKSLQKRKKRQSLASRIRNLTDLTANTLKRGTSEPAGSNNNNIGRRSQSTGTTNKWEAPPTALLHQQHSTAAATEPHRVTSSPTEMSQGMVEDLLFALDVSGELSIPLPEEEEEALMNE